MIETTPDCADPKLVESEQNIPEEMLFSATAQQLEHLNTIAP